MATKHAQIESNDDGIAFGDYALLWNVVDGHRTYFDKDTELGPATNQPIIYDHGRDKKIGSTVFGHATQRKVDDIGLWVDSQISKSAKFYELIRRLIKARAVGWSVGSTPAGYVVERGGPRGVSRVASFLLAEMTLTPTPSQVQLASNPHVRSILDFSPEIGMEEIHREIVEREAILTETRLAHMLRREPIHG